MYKKIHYESELKKKKIEYRMNKIKQYRNQALQRHIEHTIFTIFSYIFLQSHHFFVVYL